ncbi:MAG: ABC transporter substrate-binding protein, partial [Desulfurococcales archaeon]|nr:ABC transporter substrate-binding protein [Desulfurococcales archaeon]
MASIEARTRILLYATLIIAIVALGTSVYLFKSLNDAITQLDESQRALSSQVSSINYGLERVENATLDLNRLYESALSEISDLKKTLDELANKTKKLEEAMLFPITVVDATGDSITIPSKPLRIVSLLPSVTEILWSIGAEDQVVAVDEYSNYPPEVVEALKSGELTSIGSGWYPDVEAILALNPDLVIGVDSVQSHHTLKKILADYGIPVL